MVITEKWNGKTDSWIEPFNGDFQPDNSQPGSGKSWTASNRHTGFANCMFFDGHAKSTPPSDILNSKDLTGCELMYKYPFTNAGSGTPTVTSATAQSANPIEENDCDPKYNPSFSYP
jgi:prepilin-type processing-associated H-X9-DG protein